MIAILTLLEDGIAALALAAMVVLPLAEIIVRRAFGVGIPGSGPFVQHLTLWVGFLGAAIASREGKLLSLATGTFIPEFGFLSRATGDDRYHKAAKRALPLPARHETRLRRGPDLHRRVQRQRL